MSVTRWSLIGAGAGVAAGAVTTAGVVADRLLRNRRTAVRLGTSMEQFEVEADEERVVVATDGVPLAVQIDRPRGTLGGTGPQVTVVLTHGFSHDRRVWSYQRRALRAAGYRVVLWDLRGHGDSGTGDESAYTVRQLGADLAAVVDEVTGDDPLVLVGHSMGAMTVMSLIGRRPQLLTDRVIGVGLISGSAGDLATVDFGLPKRLAAAVHRVGPATVTAIAARQGLLDSARLAGRGVEEYLVHRYSFSSHVPLSAVRLTADMIFHTDLRAMGAFLSNLMEHDELASLAALTGVETLVVHGEDDRIVPLEHALVIARAVPGCEYVQLEDAGHVLPLEYPDLVDSELIGLVERARRAVAAVGGGRSQRRRKHG